MIEDLIENWVRWHAKLRWHKGQCASLEGNWSSKDYWDAPPITPLGKVDQLAAQMVEDAWKTLDFTSKMLLKWHYVFRRAPGAICRSLRQRGDSLAPAGYSVRLLLAKELLSQAIDAQRKSHHHPRIAVLCVPSPRWEADASPKEPITQ